MKNYDLNTKNIFAELTEIFRYLDIESLNRIPSNIKKEIYNNRNLKCEFKYDISKSMENQEISDDTKDLFSAIYIRYCCDKNERNMLLKTCNDNEKKYESQKQEKYNYDNIFKNNNHKKKEGNDNSDNNSEKMSIIEYKITFFSKIKKIILKLLHRKK